MLTPMSTSAAIWESTYRDETATAEVETPTILQINMRDDIMADKVQDYIETDQEREEGHQDARQRNFECENPDEHLGCDMGIDVQG